VCWNLENPKTKYCTVCWKTSTDNFALSTRQCYIFDVASTTHLLFIILYAILLMEAAVRIYEMMIANDFCLMILLLIQQESNNSVTKPTNEEKYHFLSI
jgi:hypothetical protein